MLITDNAHAKVNLTLRVLGRRADGYHSLVSLVAFADSCDTVTLDTEADRGLVVSGPLADGTGPVADNLVLTAAAALDMALPGHPLNGKGLFHLTKRLPSAAGLGGGSADAAAALRLLARGCGMPSEDPVLSAVARRIGADVAVCMEGKARVMSGVGDRLGPAVDLPRLHAVLINPGVRVETRTVFARLAAGPPATTLGGFESGLSAAMEWAGTDRDPERIWPRDPAGLLSALTESGNDLEVPAMALAADIGLVRAAVAAQPGVLLVRMSGSGATVFGISATSEQAAAAENMLRLAYPQWWIQATVLGSVQRGE